MIQTKYGDLLEAKGIIVHGVNAQGVMGSGVALQIKNKWPKVYKDYLDKVNSLGLYEAKYNLLGKVTWTRVDSETIVINAFTQENYGRDKNVVYVDYNAVRKAFRSINQLVENMSVNFPLIGCGLANGDWRIISKIIDEELDDSLEKILWVKE